MKLVVCVAVLLATCAVVSGHEHRQSARTAPYNLPKRVRSGAAATHFVWPQPQSASITSDVIQIDAMFGFSTLSTSQILKDAFERYEGLIFVHGPPAQQRAALTICTFTISSDDETLQQGTDESYSIRFDSVNSTDTSAQITSVTVFGALRALETFSQLVVFNFDTQQYDFPAYVAIDDEPRFGYRGILVDTSRHFEPIPTLRRVIDSLTYAKFNVLHWHITDMQSIPFESASAPLLWQGAYTPAERYTIDEIKGLVEYARVRGVRVMVELDGPGHEASWGVGYPQLLPENWKSVQGCDNPPLDPVNDFTYQVFGGLIKEFAGYFPEQLFHLGGDEVDTDCWSKSPSIAAWMKDHGITDYDQLYMYFVQNAHQLARDAKRTPVAWEEVFNHFGTQLDPATIIHIWLDHATLGKVVAAGYRGILSDNANWYLDHLDTTWQTMYKNEPFSGITNTTQQALVLGGEACMWGETVDTSDIMQTIWPRAAAVAERLWSAASVSDVTAATPRYEWFRCFLNTRDIGAAPSSVQGRGSPPYPGSCYTQ